MGVLCIAAVLRQNGLPASYVDCNYEPDWKERLARLAKDDPLVGITANALSIKPAMDVARHVRAALPHVRIAMGGPWPSVMFERLIPELADFVVLGEGEETVLEIARGARPEDTAGVAYPHNGGIETNPRRPLIEDLDALPFAMWELGTVDRYRLEHTRSNPVLPLMTSRGCPFRCMYCASEVIHLNRIRYRSVENVLEEFDRLYNTFGVREIQLWDDNFTMNRDRAMAVCEGIIKKGYKANLSIPAGIKPDIGDDELFRTMARAGFYFLCIAVESASKEILRKVNKKVDLDRVRGVIESANRAGILTNGYFMIGLPFDTRESMEQTIRFATSLPLYQAQFFITIPFPGTALYDMVMEKGRFLYQTDDNLYEQGYFMGRASYEMPGQFDGALVEEMYKKAYRSFFLNPKRILRLGLRRVRNPKDLIYLFIKGMKVLFRGRQF